MDDILFKNKTRAAALVEYALLLAVFMATFIFFGKKMFEAAIIRAEGSQSVAVLSIPCVELGGSAYLLGSDSEDRAICSD